MKSIAASPARTMNNTDPKVETMMISQDVSPKITQTIEKTDYLFKGKYWNWPFVDIFLFHERNESLYSTVDYKVQFLK